MTVYAGKAKGGKEIISEKNILYLIHKMLLISYYEDI